MISAEEAAANMQAIFTAMSSSRANLDGGFISEDEFQAAQDRLAIDHQKAWERARQTQGAMNQANVTYIKSEWNKNHPPEPERVMAWSLSRDDLAELRLWWDWKQLDDDVKREMLPPLCPSELTQAFMDTNPAWEFRPDGTLVAAVRKELVSTGDYRRMQDARTFANTLRVASNLLFYSFAGAFIVVLIAAFWMH